MANPAATQGFTVLKANLLLKSLLWSSRYEYTQSRDSHKQLDATMSQSAACRGQQDAPVFVWQRLMHDVCVVHSLCNWRRQKNTLQCSKQVSSPSPPQVFVQASLLYLILLSSVMSLRLSSQQGERCLRLLLNQIRLQIGRCLTSRQARTRPAWNAVVLLNVLKRL